MSDRFDLEQNIIKCWGIIDDLKEARSMDEVVAIQNYYEVRFEVLWRTFEELLANYKLTKIDHESNNAY